MPVYDPGHPYDYADKEGSCAQQQSELIPCRGRLNLTLQVSSFLPEARVAQIALAAWFNAAGHRVMPRYFFNIYNDRVLIDDEGEELPDKHSA